MKTALHAGASTAQQGAQERRRLQLAGAGEGFGGDGGCELFWQRLGCSDERRNRSGWTVQDHIDCTDIQSEIESLCGALNGDIGELNWAPVRYIHRTLSREELAGLYQAAQVALVTPLRDGVSLVAKEFVAAQNPDAPGVLVLSKFTGDAEQMPAALAVNPYDKESMAYVMHRALTMPLAERQERHRALMETISRYDARWLCDRFLRALSRPDPAPQPKIKNLLSKVLRHRETDSGRF